MGRDLSKNMAFLRLESGGSSSRAFLRRTTRLRRLYESCGMPLVVGSGIRVTLGVGTSNIRMKRDSVRTNTIHRGLKPSGVLKISTQAMRRTLLTRRHNTSCLKINTMFTANSGTSTTRLPRRALGTVYRTMSVPIITVKKVATRGVSRLGKAKVYNITIVDTVCTRGGVGRTTRRLGRTMSGVM